MDSYTITIAPNDDSGNATTLIVDTSGDQVRITDVHLHAAGGLTGGQLPTVDFRLLLQAVGTPTGSPAPIEAAPAPVQAGAPAPEVADVAAVAEEAGAAPAAAVRTRRAARPRTAKRAAAKRAAKATAEVAPEPAPEPEPAKRPRGRRAAMAKAVAKAAPAAVKRAAAPTPTTRAKAAKKAEPGGRVYRRMPEDFAGVYRQAGTAAAIADHYAVPRHTAQGWIRRQKSIDAAAGN